MFARVAVNYPIKNQGLTYSVPVGMSLSVGDMVDVPLGRRKEIGCVLEVSDTAPVGIAAKDVLALRSDYPKLSPDDLKLFQWMSEYYHYGLGQLIADSLPATKKKPRPLKPIIGKGVPVDFQPTDAQSTVIKTIQTQGTNFSKHLIHGVTGSGKTLIFLELIRSVLGHGKSVLYLLPEINLTPQFVETFSRHICCPVYTFHSEVTASEKFLIWKEASVPASPAMFIGVRSAVFLPIKNLGLIVVDEEHDSSFKQDDRCPYNARDVAIKKAQIANCPVVLGSATPALEMWQNFNAKLPGTFYYPLRERVTDASLPEIVLVDTKIKDRTQDPTKDHWPLHPKAIDALAEAVTNGEQALVFINRLGFANYVQCRACGHQFHCKNCSVTMRYFKQKNILSCQHCEYHEPLPQGCPKCGNLTLLQKGFGTERVQEELRRALPSATIERFDRDEIKTFKDLQDKLTRFHSGAIDILVGTQMLSKGHNFRRVKKVVILGIDNQLNMPDFRATEKIWQTVVQVAGRAGRYSHDGKVFIQTANPDAPLFELIQQQSFDGFYDPESKVRQMCQCPPYFRLASLYFTGRDQSKLIVHMTDVVEPMLRGLTSSHFNQVQILGPRPTVVEKRANQYSWTVLLKSQDVNQLHNLLNSFQMNWSAISGISMKIDVDPQHLG
ncbi:MAG: primosomal protein N' [Bacteriovoracia bacterium]